MTYVFFYLIIWLLQSVVGTSADRTNMLTASTTTKPECPRWCGNLTIPYPFGIGLGCSLTAFCSLSCNTSFNPPKAFFVGDPKTREFSDNPRSIHEILDISETEVRIRNMVLYDCFDLNPNQSKPIEQGMLLPPDSPFVFSTTANKIITVGCGFLTEVKRHGRTPIDICSSYCNNKDDVVAGDCLGSNGCKENSITTVLREFYFYIDRPRPASISYDRCGYGFIGEVNAFEFQGLSDFSEPNVFVDRVLQTVPVVIDWVIGHETCKEARVNTSTYGCQQNTDCIDTNNGIGGYRCGCRDGYQGNPYIPPGCSDIVQCSFGFGARGSGCTPNLSFKLLVGLAITIVCLGIGIIWIWLMIQKHRSIKKDEDFLKLTKNDGSL